MSFNWIKSIKRSFIITLDMILIAVSFFLSFYIRFDGVIPLRNLMVCMHILPFVVLIRVFCFRLFKVYRELWLYASISNLMNIIKGSISSSILIVLGVVFFFGFDGFPRSVFIIDWLLITVLIGGGRFLYRIYQEFSAGKKDRNAKRVLIVGAGDAGNVVVREIRKNLRRSYNIIGFVDDDIYKQGMRVQGIIVLGIRSDIPRLVKIKDIDEIIIAIRSATSKQMREIVNYCMRSGAKYRIIPNISDVVDGRVRFEELREVKLEDLLKREEVNLGFDKGGGEYISGKRVLITGAGGSIGSELCRQVARMSPEKMILFDKAENELFYIDMELNQFFGEISKVPVIGNMCDRRRVAEVLQEHRPQIIFHAAAYKHVPLMETNSMEAIRNNVFGTKVIAEEAVNAGVEKFIMLSTDKAVAPTSLMGVSKKIAELYISALAKKNGTSFMAVRFGNVMGSKGSVIPTFRKQISSGVPITITHPEIKRYFMTIPEAAGLVIKAGTIGEGGEIFILEMGKQIKILDVARNLIKLSGKEPGRDVKIVFTGLRPGEKMHEALVGTEENLIETESEKIFMVEDEKEKKRNIFSDIGYLEELIDKSSIGDIVEFLKEIIPSYTPSLQMLKETSSGDGEGSLKKNMGILIVDDEKIIKSILCKYLEGLGYNTFIASNGKEALDVIRGNNISIAIVDIRMPGFINGLQVLKQIRKLKRNIEVMIVTGFGGEKIKSLCEELDATYLEKPFELVQIKEYVEGVQLSFSGLVRQVENG